MVDVFSEWAGPCNAMQNYLKKIKLEVKNDNIVQVITTTITITKVGDEHLHCAMARCDSIDALKVENLLKIDALI